MERIGVFLLAAVAIYLAGMPLFGFALLVSYAAFGFVLPVHDGEFLGVVLGLGWLFVAMMAMMAWD